MILKIVSNRKRLYPEAFKPALVDIALVGVFVPLDAVQKGCSADPHSLPLREQEDDRTGAVAGTSRRVEDTPQKLDRRSSPEQMNSTLTNHFGGSYSPTDLCVQAMGRKDLFAVSCVVVFCHRTEPIPDKALYGTSRVSEETGGEGTPVPELISHIKKEVNSRNWCKVKPFPFPSCHTARHGTHAHTHARRLLARHAHTHGPA
jgi:hypothetical protein